MIVWPEEYINVEYFSNKKYRFISIGVTYKLFDEVKPEEKNSTATNLEFDKGAVIKLALVGGAAYKAGIRNNDIITNVNGMSITGPYMLQWVLNAYGSKGPYSITYLRNDIEYKTILVLNSSEEEVELPIASIQSLMTLADSLALRYKFKPGLSVDAHMEYNNLSPSTMLSYKSDYPVKSVYYHYGPKDKNSNPLNAIIADEFNYKVLKCQFKIENQSNGSEFHALQNKALEIKEALEANNRFGEIIISSYTYKGKTNDEKIIISVPGRSPYYIKVHYNQYKYKEITISFTTEKNLL
jgi:hypothetical protein